MKSKDFCKKYCQREGGAIPENGLTVERALSDIIISEKRQGLFLLEIDGLIQGGVFYANKYLGGVHENLIIKAVY